MNQQDTSNIIKNVPEKYEKVKEFKSDVPSTVFNRPDYGYHISLRVPSDIEEIKYPFDWQREKFFLQNLIANRDITSEMSTNTRNK